MALAIFVPSIVQAIELDRGDYRYRDDVVDFIKEVAARSDYSEQELVDLFAQVRHQRHLFERMDKPAEKLDWHQYRKIFITEKRINKGLDFFKKHRELLQQVEQTIKCLLKLLSLSLV